MMFGSVMDGAGMSVGGASAMGSMMSSFVEDWSTSRGTTATTISEVSSLPGMVLASYPGLGTRLGMVHVSI